ncbi:MAG TPA: class I SAM-dependent methyltransferase [Bdellovibrionales bacterium]|mgnify:CR=1 FL=1|nr:class I SAM-dependent methyltransferase [Bdellovibrionales bacterium]
MSEFDGYRDIYQNEIDGAVSFVGQGQDFFTKVKGNYILELLAAENLSTYKVLDVGCGHGLVHGHLISALGSKLNLTGIDVAGTVVEVARKNHPGASYDTYEGTRLPYADHSFDMAFTICVMHHVEPGSWSGFLAEMKRVVRPGGLIAVFEHNPLNPLTRRVVNNCPLDENAVLLRASTLTTLLKRTGLSEVRQQFISFTPFGGRFFQWFDRQMGWLPLGAQYFATGRNQSRKDS